jgi:hypothetical protein
MKKGQDIKDMLRKINNDTCNKRDYLINLKSIKVNTNDYVYPSIEINHLTTGEYTLNDNSLNHLCNKLEIGTKYISKCLPVSQELVSHNLNFWIKNTKEKELMLRTYDTEPLNEARAILSNRYKRIDIDNVANHTLDRLMDMNAELKYSYYDRDNVNITAVLPKLEGEVVKGDIVQGGITITNSEVGSGSLIIKPFVYRLVCTNGMVAPSYLNQFYAKHVGKMLINAEDDEQWKSIIDKMQQQLDLVSNPEVFEENLQRLKQATNERINSHQIIQLAKKQSISDDERAGIFERLNHYVGDQFSVSKYELANAVTNLANDENKTDARARFLQELGGMIIFSNNLNQVRI